MAKILLVEDDQSLREIYGIRLTAEGYEIVPAGDGEEALAAAVREKPDLIISDVMMPKISGFDMLDILRSTPETKNIKVIMMTALSSEDQRERGEALGADRFLVKSQVGIEDVVNAVHEILDQNNTEQNTTLSENDTTAFNPPSIQSNVFQIQQPASEMTAQTTTQFVTETPVQTGAQTVQQSVTPQTTQPTIQSTAQSTTQPMTQTTDNTFLQPAGTKQTSQQAFTSPTFSNQSHGISPQNDSYSINSVTDDSGMNIKDQMDQILGGMGSV